MKNLIKKFLIILFVILTFFIIAHIDGILNKTTDIKFILISISYNIAWMISISCPIAALILSVYHFKKNKISNIIEDFKPVLVLTSALVIILTIHNLFILPEANFKYRKLYVKIIMLNNRVDRDIPDYYGSRRGERERNLFHFISEIKYTKMRIREFQNDALNSKRKSQIIISLKRSLLQQYIEIQKRIAIPFSCIVLSILGTLIGYKFLRLHWAILEIISVLIFLIFWGFLIWSENPLSTQIIHSSFGIWLPNITIGAISTLLLVIATKI